MPTEDLKEVQIGLLSFQATKISTSLFEEEERELVDRLIKNINLFPWDPSDMSGIGTKVVIHLLAIHPSSKLVVQSKQKLGEGKRAAIDEEMDKLSDAGFIRETKYPTLLAKVVLVHKANNILHTCINFTNINFAYHEDSYLLPDIYHMLSLMDAYSGYNQIHIDPLDSSKTLFISNPSNY